MVSQDGTAGVFPKNSADLVIMNPPFTNSAKRGGKFSDSLRGGMQDHEKAIISSVKTRNQKLAETIHAKSMSTWFLPAVAELLIHKNGTLAFVAPTTMCIGNSGKKSREYLAKHYHVETIVTSHDPKRVAFSENTDIHESLFILRRSSEKISKPTEFFNLRKMPTTQEEVLQTLHWIKSRRNSSPGRSNPKAAEILGPAGPWGKQTKFLARQIQNEDWSGVQWYQPEIQDILRKIQDHPDLIQLGKQFEVGPAGRRISDAFEPCPANEAEIYEFRTASMNTRDRMIGKPEQPVKTRKGKESKAKIYLGQRSSLLICWSLNTHSSSMVSTYCYKPAFGSRWIPVRGMQPEHEKAVCAWFNSTPSLYQFLNSRARTLTWPTYHPSQTRQFLIPDFTQLDHKPLLDAFEQVKDQPLDRFRHIPTNPARQVLDRAAAETLGIPYTEIQEWGRLLAAEPTISNQMAPLEEETAHE